jgi:hypothetical protein
MLKEIKLGLPVSDTRYYDPEMLPLCNSGVTLTFNPTILHVVSTSPAVQVKK